jgi:hypothetical protein
VRADVAHREAAEVVGACTVEPEPAAGRRHELHRVAVHLRLVAQAVRVERLVEEGRDRRGPPPLDLPVSSSDCASSQTAGAR